MEVKPVILGSPGEHHKILEFLHNNGDKKSYVHVDNHPDNTRPMGGFCIVKPCSVFMNDVLRNDCFEKVYWLQKNYNPENPYKIEDYNGGVWNFKDLEDAIQYQVAAQNGAQFFLTRNLQDFKNATLPVMTAEEFLKTL